MQTMPTITVSDKLFVHIAMKRVGIIAVRILQSIDKNDSFSMIILSIINAVKIQTGIKDNHLVTTTGSFTFLTTKKGITLGIMVTIAQPKIIRKIVKSILICPSSPQLLPQ